jgi:hypothetical protein
MSFILLQFTKAQDAYAAYLRLNLAPVPYILGLDGKNLFLSPQINVLIFVISI